MTPYIAAVLQKRREELVTARAKLDQDLAELDRFLDKFPSDRPLSSPLTNDTKEPEHD